MATYALTVSTDALGLGVINGAIVVAERKRTTVNDIYPTSSLYIKKSATNVSGIATIQLEADDGTVFHEIKIFDTSGVLVYKNTIQMPPQAADIEDLPLNDIITESAQQAAASAQEAAASAASIRVDAATFASIPELVNPCLVFVDADETNDNLPTVYFYDGTNLNWIPMVGV